MPRVLSVTLALVFFLPPGVAAAEPEVDSALARIRAAVAELGIERSGPGWKTSLPPPPVVDFTPDRTYHWVLETSLGVMKFELFPDIAPVHVSSTLYLTELGFFEGLGFHRVIPDFMAQGGDPTGTGRGNPGYLMDGEFTNKRQGRHRKRGVLSAANRGPGTDGSQFFILFKGQPELDGKHTVYGQLVEGKQTLREIERVGTRKGTPKEEVEIVSAAVEVR